MDTGDFQLLKQGAEARLYKGTYLGKPTIVKERFPKTYRHSDLDDRLTKDRTRGEVRGLMRAKNVGIRTPAVYLVRPKTRSIYMEFLEGVDTVNDYIGRIFKRREETEGHPELEKLAVEIGKTLGKLHEAGIIHGDLTTSNILVERILKASDSVVNDNAGNLEDITDRSRVDFSIILIDFGLSHMDNSAEDKGVDLYVLERALTSTYSSIQWFFECILKAYISEYKKGGEEVFVKLEEIRLRGRKRTMVG